MVASKFLHDDGSEDEVVDVAWAISGRLTLSKTIKLEMDFLKAVVSYIWYNYLYFSWSFIRKY